MKGYFLVDPRHRFPKLNVNIKFFSLYQQLQFAEYLQYIRVE